MNSTQLNQIFQTLSFERMQTYENKTRTREQAVELYLWNSQFHLVFPHTNLSKSVQKNREHLHNDLDIVRRLRNRIAHHEPIFDEKLLSIYNKIIKIISYRCQETANWVASHQTVTTLIAQKPKI